jgi:hypothetical protein
MVNKENAMSYNCKKCKGTGLISYSHQHNWFDDSVTITEACDCNTGPTDAEVDMLNAQLKSASLYGTLDEIIKIVQGIKHTPTRNQLWRSYGVIND